MPAIGVMAPLYFIAQAVAAAGVYRVSGTLSRTNRAIIAGLFFMVGVAGPYFIGSIGNAVAVQVVLLAIAIGVQRGVHSYMARTQSSSK